MFKDRPIGVIDSGVGGLSVLKCLRHTLPQEDFIYLGDTQRAPYGSHTEEEVREYVEEILQWFDKQQVKFVVVACNTITVLGIESLKRQHQFELAGMSKGERLVLEASKNKKIGVLATPFTISTQAHKQAILACDSTAQVYPQACADFVPLIEKECLTGPVVENAVSKYVAVMKEHGVDTVILSCTHYPFIKDIIEKHLGSDVTVIDPADATAELVKEKLEQSGLLKESGIGHSLICCTAGKDRLKRLAEKMQLTENSEFAEINLFQK